MKTPLEEAQKLAGAMLDLGRRQTRAAAPVVAGLGLPGGIEGVVNSEISAAWAVDRLMALHMQRVLTLLEGTGQGRGRRPRHSGCDKPAHRRNPVDADWRVADDAARFRDAVHYLP